MEQVIFVSTSVSFILSMLQQGERHSSGPVGCGSWIHGPISVRASCQGVCEATQRALFDPLWCGRAIGGPCFFHQSLSHRGPSNLAFVEVWNLVLLGLLFTSFPSAIPSGFEGGRINVA